MKSLLLLCSAILCLACHTPAMAQTRSPIYPFDVKIGGQTAVIEGSAETAIFAKIKEPVAADAVLEAVGTSGMLIINVFPVEPNGTVPSGVAPKVILAQEGPSAKLDATMDKSKLEPGLYGANVVAGQATSRVMFTVK